MTLSMEEAAKTAIEYETRVYELYAYAEKRSRSPAAKRVFRRS